MLAALPICANAQDYMGAGDYSWGRTEYKGAPWVDNTSRPYDISRGLYNRHITVWASHGRYYDSKTSRRWKWQRPVLFTTCEDLFTQTIVTPFLIPMLENAGAVVFSPRERDWQRGEAVVDNDGSSRGSQWTEVRKKGKWKYTYGNGFAYKSEYYDNQNPFTLGTARQCNTTKKKKKQNYSYYQPYIPEEGRYAVYVSYKTVDESVDDARYTVWHKGEATTFSVNQQIGGGTWVYLGTFDFDKGCNEFNRVELSNLSSSKGVVTTDAVRFGGGMGSISRGGYTSGLPRCLEGARYYAQYAGMPYSVYSTRQGTDDYSDDINARSLSSNYIGGGSCYMPNAKGLGVPIELSLAVHSDAGVASDGNTLVGSLSICTTDFNDGLTDAGLSRHASRQFADALLANIKSDLTARFGEWRIRKVLDKNYSETRLPNVPSAIIETLSHQNFGDMRLALDPNFRFTLARSIYKTVLRYVADMHSGQYAVTPLTPDNFNISLTADGDATLSWTAVDDPQEPSAHPTGYVVYMATGTADFDNGTLISSTSCQVTLEPDVLYSFRVAALNKGGISFPSEVLCVRHSPSAAHTVMIVNAFYRLASPLVVNSGGRQGFDIDTDMGVSPGVNAGVAGRQLSFDASMAGKEGKGSLGYGNDEIAGTLIGGNDFDYVRTHADAIRKAGKYNIVSCSAHALENGKASLSGCDVTDIIFGLQKHDGWSLVDYKTFTPQLRRVIADYTRQGGNMLVSGAFIASDMRSGDERQFTASILGYSLNGTYRGASNTVSGMGTTLSFMHNALKGSTTESGRLHYAAPATDRLSPTGNAFAAMTYGDGSCACVAYNGSAYKALSMGFPFECITGDKKQASIMRGMLRFLTGN